ncbi:MAG TPA: rubrerythrin family protein [Halanaerobiales bacterium]|nr:rubrerythrin family protein [Halanaerobiales bacterium]
MVKNDMTAQNLRSAFGGESQAYQRYKVWGDKAEEDGYPNVGLLFRAIAYAEEVHASNHFEALDNVDGDFLVASNAGYGIGDTVENLEGAREGELFEINQMYPSYQLVAKEQKENEAIRSFHYAIEAEKIHAKMFLDAKDSVKKGNDIELESVSVCEVCGHTVKDGTPDECPICQAKKEEFKEFTK